MANRVYSSPSKGVMESTISLEAMASDQMIERIVSFNANPSTRATASRLLNENTRAIITEARRIAFSEFRTDRPFERRPPESQTHGRHYEESFTVAPATQTSIGDLKVTWKNDHPSARRIEFGTSPHNIPLQEGTAKGRWNGQTGWLIFPYKSGSSLYGGPGSPPGDWLAAGKGTGVRQVDHPGHLGFHIMERAVARVRSTLRR